MTKRKLTFGTRGSTLARYQTTTVANSLQEIFPELQVETIIFSTRGDRELNKPLPEIGGKGVFTAELEAALRAGQIDLAVHSLKDLPTEDAAGLHIGAILTRHAPGDALVSRAGYTLATLPLAAAVGTSSLRRRAQLLETRPDLRILPIRGNIDTRIAKAMAADGPYEAIVLAAAGLKRLGLAGHISEYISFEAMLPAPGQGAIAVQCRADDSTTLRKLAQIDHVPTRQAVLAERTFLAELDAGCRLPVAAFGKIEEEKLIVQGLVASLDGRQVIRASQVGSVAAAQRVGQALAQKALSSGAQAILEEVRVQSPQG